MVNIEAGSDMITNMLLIIKAEVSDTGLYICEAINSFGSSMFQTFVNVFGELVSYMLTFSQF